MAKIYWKGRWPESKGWSLTSSAQNEGGETVEQVAQRGGGSPIPGNMQSSLDGALMEGKVPLLIAGSWARWPWKVPSSPNHSLILQFSDSVIQWSCSVQVTPKLWPTSWLSRRAILPTEVSFIFPSLFLSALTPKCCLDQCVSTGNEDFSVTDNINYYHRQYLCNRKQGLGKC